MTSTVVTATTDFTPYIGVPVKVTRDLALCGGPDRIVDHYGTFNTLNHSPNDAGGSFRCELGTCCPRGCSGALYVPYGSTITVRVTEVGAR